MRRKTLFLTLFFLSFVAFSISYAMEYIFNYGSCKLCVLQRSSYFGVSFLSLLAFCIKDVPILMWLVRILLLFIRILLLAGGWFGIYQLIGGCVFSPFCVVQKHIILSKTAFHFSSPLSVLLFFFLFIISFLKERDKTLG